MKIFVVLHEKIDIITSLFKVNDITIDIFTNHCGVMDRIKGNWSVCK